MGAGVLRMVDQVAAAARRPPLQAAQLIDQPLKVQEPRPAGVETYRRIFPSLFKPFAAMPLDLQTHIRYPEDLFNIQALQYRAYHMDVPEVFYNREDLWQFPREPVAPEGMNDGGMKANSGTRMAPSTS